MSKSSRGGRGGKITDVPGILVGHWTNRKARTGCTAILFPRGTTGGVDVSGSAPATRDTRLLEAGSGIDEVHGLVFSGGSAYGLDSAGGVMRYLEKKKIGHVTSAALVPIVPAAAIYDLGRGDPSARPGAAEGEKAAGSAAKSFGTGVVGAGTGASCSKWKGIAKALPSGIGTASVRRGKLVVGALAVVNPVGDIVDERGRVLLGHGAPQALDIPAPEGNTVLIAAAANARLDKLQCIQAAQRIRDGVARSVYPSHTKHDGDVGFFFSCGGVEEDLDVIFVLTADATAAAIRNVAHR
jgi:L-aminopeptidase/D-esterase-like protein